MVVCTRIVYMLLDCVEMPPTNVTKGLGFVGSLSTFCWRNTAACFPSDSIYGESAGHS